MPSSPPPLFVLGAGGHAKVVISILRETGFRIKGVLDDDRSRWGQELMEIPIMGAIEDLATLQDVRGVIAIGNNNVRKKLAETYPHVQWVTAVHYKAYVHPTSRANIGPGTVISAGAIIQPDVTIGSHSIINTSTSVDHDCEIGSYVHLAPGVHLAGGVKVGDGVLMGVGSSAIPLASIGNWSVIGAGAGVMKAIPPNTKAIGFPAKPMLDKKDQV
jgi:sugar O-acyltransferase (sialic acid O-acetyltransferase NeuD family)